MKKCGRYVKMGLVKIKKTRPIMNNQGYLKVLFVNLSIQIHFQGKELSRNESFMTYLI